MSADSLPITSARFSKALADLSLSSLYLKADELKNSIAHLEKSNAELEEYVRAEQDKDCYEALVENKEVIGRMQERIELVKREVEEVRGLPWKPESEEKYATEPGETGRTNGANGVGVDAVNGDANAANGGQNGTAATSTNGSTQSTDSAQIAQEDQEGVFL